MLTHGLHYASAVFEGERAYGGAIFKCTEHSERLKRSGKILDFEIPYSVAEIDAAKRLIVEKNNMPNCYVRAIAWRIGGREAALVQFKNNRKVDGKWVTSLDVQYMPMIAGIRKKVRNRSPSSRVVYRHSTVTFPVV